MGLWLRPAAAAAAALVLLLLGAAPALANPPQPSDRSGSGSAAPTAAFRVVIDAGHGGKDPGAATPLQPLLEKDVTLRLAQLTGAALQRRGVGVVYTRGDDRTVSLAERAALAQRTGAHALLSLHLNTAPNPAASGAEAWYGSSAQSADLAAAVLGALAQPLRAHGVAVRGTRPGSRLVVLQTPVPAALVELGYLTNERDAQALAQPQFLAAAAEALAEGIGRFRASREAASGAARVAAAFVPDVYFVRLGDTLQSVAARFRLAGEEIARLNTLADPDQLRSGQPLQLQAPAGAEAAPPVAAPVSPASAGTAGQGTPRTYTVAPGDSLSHIAERTGLSVPDLVRLNGLQHPDLIRAGQTLRLEATQPAAKGGAAGRPAERRYRVQPGDTLFALAVRFGVPLDSLLRANGLRDPDKLLAGTELAIRG